MYDTAIEMAKRLLVDSIWKSANLEGLGTTFPKTAAILENAEVNTTRDEVFFIVNMKRAWNFLLSTLDYETDLMILREFNKIAGEGLFFGNGVVRNSVVTVTGTTWVPEIPDSSTIVETLRNLNTIEDPIEKALQYFCYIARTQIFNDGNKRVAQLVANKILIERDVGIFQVPPSMLHDFRVLLVDFYETNESTKLIAFMREHCIFLVSRDIVIDDSLERALRIEAEKRGFLSKDAQDYFIQELADTYDELAPIKLQGTIYEKAYTMLNK